MMNVTIREEWFNEIKNLINYEDDYHYNRDNIAMVEVDVEENEFRKVSEELDWM